MTFSLSGGAAAAAALALALAGCGGDGNAEQALVPTAAPAAEPVPAATATASASAVAFDRAFIDGMIPHHEQAIEMAKAAKDAGLANADLVEIADAIIATQQGEIDQMRTWREQWFGSGDVDPNGADALGLSMREMGMDHDAGMMMGADDVDATFAAEMIDHHQGATRMAELALERAEHRELREFAAGIIENQQAEIDTMADHIGMSHG